MQKLMRWHDVRADEAIHFGEWPQEYGPEPQELLYFRSVSLPFAK